jgi:GNAT superfamily N-acetyltransferase
MATRADDQVALSVRPAEAGEPWYTWRRALRSYTPAPGRRVFNAYRGDQLLGSALVETREAGPEDPPSSVWDFADSLGAFQGPYFNLDESVPEPVFLHFESMYVRENARRSGVALALTEAVADVGLPTYCQFAAKFLVPVFAGWDADLDEDDRWTKMSERPAGELASNLEFALEGESTPQRLAAGRFTAHVRTRLERCGPAPHVRSVDAPEGEINDEKLYEQEGTPEADVRELDPDDQRWDEDDAEYQLDWLEQRIRFQLAHERSGIVVDQMQQNVIQRVVAGSDQPATVEWTIQGNVEDPGLLEMRAVWRRFLATFDAEWEPSTLTEAIAEIVRDSDYAVEALRVSR